MRAFSRLNLAIMVSLCSSGCDDDTSGPQGALDGGTPDGGKQGSDTTACMEADVAVSLRRQNDPALVPLRNCQTDADCTLFTETLFECPERNISLSDCSLAIAKVRLDAGPGFIAALEAELCPTLPRDCRGGASCPPVIPRCVAGQCATALPDAGN